MGLKTLNDIFLQVADSDRLRLLLQHQPSGWLPVSSAEFYRDVVGVARGLQEMGIVKGDRVAILSENRVEWAVTDYAILAIGAVTVPIYSTLTPDQTAFILRDSGARVVAVSTQEQLDKVLLVLAHTPVEHVLVMDNVETAHATHLQRLTLHGPGSRDAAFDALARSAQPSDLATIIYTSGTTGPSKGAMLTHGNMASNVDYSMKHLRMRSDDLSLSYLPLSHVTARHVDFSLLYRGVTIAYCPFMENLGRSLVELKPTIFVAVPRVYEKIRMQAIHKATKFPAKQIFHWALAVGRRNRSQVLAGRRPRSLAWQLADRLIYSKIREAMGGKIVLYLSGGAPLGRELVEWYADAGIAINEGYGLTETSPVIAVNTPHAYKLGAVGKPLDNLEVSIAADGEVLVRGPSVFHGYWNRPEESSPAFVDGWFKTGDIGNLDADGFLSITDRKKDLIKTSGGKFIAPQPIENTLKLNPLIGSSAILGEKRKFPAVLISPHFPMLEDWARANQIVFTSREELIAHPKVQSLYEGIVSDLNTNLARFEKLKRVILVSEEFSPGLGTLTPTFKLRRKGIEERYRQQIEAMYEHADLSTVPAR